MPDRSPYASDLTHQEWEILEPLLPRPKSGTSRGGRPQQYPTREIVNGIRYVLRSGCAWRLLPHDLPPWWTTYHYFNQWKKDGTWQRVHDRLRGDVRAADGRNRQPSAAIIDSQSVKTTEKGAFAATMRAKRSAVASVT